MQENNPKNSGASEKFCVDCKHLNHVKIIDGYGWLHIQVCTKRMLQVHNPVTGYLEPVGYEYPTTAREKSSLCGKEARWFEKREPYRGKSFKQHWEDFVNWLKSPGAGSDI